MNLLETPQSVGVIVDGNRRWAKKEGVPIFEGHRAGYRNFKNFVDWAAERGIRFVTAYIFSTENWNRPTVEVNFLLELLESVLGDELLELKNKNVRLKVIGDISLFASKLQELIKKAVAETAENGGITLVLALSYGGREELRQAAEKKATHGGKLEDYLWTRGIPDPDLIIRTSGEMRLSNFLPWQAVYSELFFVKTLWPDFTKDEFLAILEEYKSRQRRFGK